MKIIYQEKDNDCGLACCTMIINHFHIENLTLADLERDFPVINSLSVSEVENILIKHNIECESYEVDVNNLCKNKPKGPFIALVKNYNQTHFVIVKEIHKGVVTLLDPASGSREISIKQFEKIFLNIITVPKKPKLILNFKDRKLFIEKNTFIFKVILLEFFIFLTMTISVGFLRVVLDVFVKNQDINQLIAISLWFLLISIIRNLLIYVLNLIKKREVERVFSSFSHRIISEIFNKDKSFFETNTRAKFLSLDDHILKTSYFSVNAIPTIVTGLMFLSFTACFFWLLDYRFALIWLCVSAVHLSVSIIVKGKYKKHIKKIKDSYFAYKQNLINSFDLSENNSGFGKTDQTLSRTLNSKENYFSHMKKHSMLETDSHLVFGTLEFLFSQIYAIVGVLLIWKGFATIGVVIFVLSFHSHINHQIEMLFHFYTSLPEYRNSESIVKKFLFVKNNTMNTGYKIKNKVKEIIIKRLNCEKGDRLILDGYSAKLVPWTIITGETGTGKSTLMDCISKKLSFWNGEIKYSNVPLKEIDGEWLKSKVIHADNFLPLLDMKISEFLEKAIKNKEMVNILNKYNIDLERNLNSNLSSGQKEIINFLHTISLSAEIYFVDEPLPHCDKEKRYELYSLAKDILKDKFVVCISHDKNIANIFEKEVSL